MTDGSASSQAGSLAQGLRALLLALALWVGWGLATDLQHLLDSRRHWLQHAATVVSTADERDIEIEVPEALLVSLGDVRQPESFVAHAPEHTRILLAAPRYSLLGPGDAVVLAQDPAAPARTELLDPVAQGAPIVAKLVWIGLLGLAALGLRRARWGADLSWADGRWGDTATLAQRPGLLAGATQVLEETATSRRATLVWCAILGPLLIGTLVSTAVWGGDAPIEAGTVAIVCALLLGVLAIVFGENWTRRIHHDAAGLSETTLLRTRRVAWSAVAGFDRVNINDAAQRRHDQRARRTGPRPPTIYVWRLSDAAGREILQLADTLSPPEAFDALCERLARQVEPGDGASPVRHV
jgi:hypothetical protein